MFQLNSLKIEIAPGHDNVNAELFKADPELAAVILSPLFTKIWEQEEIQSGSLSDCNNWR